jgi:hypothetical protein
VSVVRFRPWAPRHHSHLFADVRKRSISKKFNSLIPLKAVNDRGRSLSAVGTVGISVGIVMGINVRCQHMLNDTRIRQSEAKLACKQLLYTLAYFGF